MRRKGKVRGVQPATRTGQKHLTPARLPAPPAQVPRRVDSRKDLLGFQRFMAHALYQPLARDDSIAARWRDGRRMSEVAAEFIRPNDRLTAVERLQIYARCYWYRVTESVYEDCPGLRAALGEKRFAALVRAYLTKYPSRSFTLRDLCARLPQFIREAPHLTAPHTGLADAIARFEWAQTVAFDAASHPPLSRDEIADAPPAKLRVSLQPHASLLALDWPVDDYVTAVKRRESARAEASHTISDVGAARLKRVARPARERVHVVVHRHRNRLYYKRISAPAFSILAALAQGATLNRALAAGGSRVSAEDVRAWFATWMELGWFCRRRPSRE